MAYRAFTAFFTFDEGNIHRLICIKVRAAKGAITIIMNQIEFLRHQGIFDSKVPRYTSYPPANLFVGDAGRMNQRDFLGSVAENEEISLYVHIPFCKRLCWFCACRTQGTKKLAPVDAYVSILQQEILAVRARLPKSVRLSRLHFGGGTPTLLPAKTMEGLLNSIFSAFQQTDSLEFSVEIDPTEVTRELMSLLIDAGMNRASLGVQDFAPQVQEAIGRPQSVQQTEDVIVFLRENGTPSINLDLLYGLPLQTTESFQKTIDHVLRLRPERLAIYGYAHVPWMSKRQVMIKDEDLPGPETRLNLSFLATSAFVGAGYQAIGIDHFALPDDSLARSLKTYNLRRNFQGYTDDRLDTLIGVGASAISQFKEGYVQNSPATATYCDLVKKGGFAGAKGYVLTVRDRVISDVIMDLMCYFEFREASLLAAYPDQKAFISEVRGNLMALAGELFEGDGTVLRMHETAKPLVRIIAAKIDKHRPRQRQHSAAI